MQKTKIEYLKYVWNPLAMLCTPTESPGCLNCWHRRFAKRHAGNPLFSRDERAAWAGTGPPVLRLDELEAPLKLKKPSRIGVQFMGDLFHKNVAFNKVAIIFGIIAFCQNHRFILLTKRPDRMLEFFSRFHGGNYRSNYRWWQNEACYGLHRNIVHGIRLRREPESLPLPNLWLGVSVSNQADLDRWGPILMQIPAAKRIVSYEPALGPVDFEPWLPKILCEGCHGDMNYVGQVHATQGHHTDPPMLCGYARKTVGLDLIIAGGESGPGARPSHPDWFRKVRDDCDAAGVPFFLKQFGEWVDWTNFENPRTSAKGLNKNEVILEDGVSGGHVIMRRVGKKAAGRELDGMIHDGWPEE